MKNVKKTIENTFSHIVFPFIACFVAALLLIAADSLPQSLDDSLLSQITGKEELRFFGGYKQGLDSSCGIAATATLLQYFFNIPIDEKHLIDKFFAAMNEKKDYTVSMLDIRNVCESYGFKTKGVKTDLSTLTKYNSFIPIVLHFLKPQAHFTIFLGTYGQYVFLDDPSVGAYFMSASEFATKFSGYALFVFGMDNLKNRDLIKKIQTTLIGRITLLYLTSQQRIGQ